ncbi:MAG: transcription elongation factor Spt4 [archaeon]|nr:transcription elongation factor Spt4 [archaeon]
MQSKKELACRKCNMLTNGRICSNCHSSDLRRFWSGMIVIVNPSESVLSRALEITKPGRYALKVI